MDILTYFKFICFHYSWTFDAVVYSPPYPKNKHGGGSTEFHLDRARRTHQIARKGNKIRHGQSINVGFGGKRNEQIWQCVEGCGACCKLAKGSSFTSPKEIFKNPSDIELYKSMIAADGWCIHFEKSTCKCSIHEGNPQAQAVAPTLNSHAQFGT